MISYAGTNISYCQRSYKIKICHLCYSLLAHAQAEITKDMKVSMVLISIFNG